MLPNKINDMNEHSRSFYLLAVWVITVFTAPFIYLFATAYLDSTKLEDIYDYFTLLTAMLAFGAMLSIPALGLFYVADAGIRRLKLPVLLQKTALSVAGIGLIILSFFALDQKYFLNRSAYSLFLPGSYAIVLVTAIFLVKMKDETIDKL